MKQVIKSTNAALSKLPWWKKILLILLYPIVMAITWLAWRSQDKLAERLEKED